MTSRAPACPKIALEWILVEAEKAGLLINCEKANIVLGRIKPVPLSSMPDYVEPNNEALMHDSLRGPWWILEYFPRKLVKNGRPVWDLPRGKWVRQIPAGSLIHQSVLTGKNTHALPDGCTVEPWFPYRRPAIPDAAVP